MRTGDVRTCLSMYYLSFLYRLVRSTYIFLFLRACLVLAFNVSCLVLLLLLFAVVAVDVYFLSENCV